MISAVIFDFDGVIVDSERIHLNAFNRVLAPYGKQISWNDYLGVYIGFDDRDAFRCAMPDIDSKTLFELIEEKETVFQNLITTGGIIALPGAVELINNLAEKIPVALCSGARKADIDLIINGLNIRQSFSAIITAEDTAVSKPDPAPYRKAWETLSKKFPQLTDPSTAVAIEDTAAGIKSAKGAGLRTLAVTNSYPAEKLSSADAVVNSLAGLTLEKLQLLF